MNTEPVFQLKNIVLVIKVFFCYQFNMHVFHKSSKIWAKTFKALHLGDKK